MPEIATLPRLLKELRLPAIARQWQAVEKSALEHHWTLGQYLAALCEQELAHRHSERLRRHFKESRLPATKTLERFDFAACPVLNPVRIAQLARYPDWVERRENLLLFGPSGVGKTHLAAAIGHGLIEQGVRVHFSATTALVQSLQQAKQQLRLAEALERLDKYAVLVLDDLGYVRKSDTETAVLFELIAHRYETGSLIVTANQPFSAWDGLFPDPMMTVAAVDRLVHHAHIIDIQADSYRKRQSHQRQAADRHTHLGSPSAQQATQAEVVPMS